MKYIGRFLGWILLGINLCMVVLLLVCAYSPYIDPVAHPVWSCAGLAFPAFLIVNLLFLKYSSTGLGLSLVFARFFSKAIVL